MLILAAEASTKLASVALTRDEILLGQFVSDNPKTHSEVLNQAIEDILAKEKLDLSQIDLFAVGSGPGSFTGVRVAINIIRTFSYLFQKPIFASDSLEILKNNEKNKTKKNSVCMINAYKNMVYTSVYANSQRVFGPEAVQVLEFQNVLESLKVKIQEKNAAFDCFGDGYEAYKNIFENLNDLIPSKDTELNFPLALTLAKMAYRSSLIDQKNIKTLDWKSVIPLYLRASAAEENIK